MELTTLLVTSPFRGDGKSTVSCNLAFAFAGLSAARATALIELDLRAPSIAPALGLQVDRGVDDILRGRANLERAKISLDQPELDLLLAREPESAAHKLLAKAEFGALIASLAASYQTVIIDSPPVLLAPDAAMILDHADGCLMVARSGKTPIRAIEKAAGILGEKHVGSILNDGRLAFRKDRYGYGYGYGYGPDPKDERN